MANKVLFGLKNVHYAVLTESASALPSWGTPTPILGAVSLQISAEGAENTFYADNTPYWREDSNNGYSGTLEVAKFPDTFLKDVFGYTENTAKVLAENAKANAKPFALLFQIDGDANEDYFVFYRCFAGRPNLNGNTINENGKEVQTQSIEISILPVIDPTGTALDGIIKMNTKADTTESVKEGWFDEVYTG